MRLLSRLTCTVVGHRPSGGQATYDEAADAFVDVAQTQYAVCTRCGDVRPAPLAVVDDPDDVADASNTDEGDASAGDTPGDRPIGASEECVSEC